MGVNQLYENTKFKYQSYFSLNLEMSSPDFVVLFQEAGPLSAVRLQTVSRCVLRAPVGLDNVFDLPPADGTAGVGHLLEFDAAAVAQTHVPTGVDNRVHRVLVTDGALIGPRPTA